TLLLAGHETTSNWLTFTWLALAEHPAVEARLHAELDGVLGAAPVEAADLERLPYLRAVLEETLRLYPPAWGGARWGATTSRGGPSSASPSSPSTATRGSGRSPSASTRSAGSTPRRRACPA